MANIQKIKIGNDTYSVALPYGTCSTAAGTKIKAVSINNYPTSGYAAGDQIIVYFENGNTNSAPQLSINSGTSLNVSVYTNTGTNATNWRADAIIHFTFNGTGWVINSIGAFDSVIPTKSGDTVSWGSGYIVAGSQTIDAGTIDVNTATVSPNALSGSWNSTSQKYIISQASKTVTDATQSTVTTAGYMSSSRGTKNKGDVIISAPSNLEIAKATFSTSGNTVSSATAGYIPAGVDVGSVSAGVIDVTDLEITPSALSGAWDSTNNKYVVSQASKTATMQSTVTTAGYVSSSVGTKNTGTATVKASSNLEIAKATFEVSGASIKTTSSGAGYIPASTTVGTVASGTSSVVGTLPQGATSTDVSYGHYVKIGAGYYSQDKYYQSTASALTFPTTTASSAAQYYSSIASITPSTADQYINLPVGYNNSGKYYKINAAATGSATPGATVSGSSSALTSPTAMNNQYFTVTPTASVGTAGWITSISNGTQLKYKVKDGSVVRGTTTTASGFNADKYVISEGWVASSTVKCTITEVSNATVLDGLVTASGNAGIAYKYTGDTTVVNGNTYTKNNIYIYE